MDSFEIEVDCSGGGTPHVHKILVSCKRGEIYNVGPSRVRLRYDCPHSGEQFIASFNAPAETGRPFKIEGVS
jgi:hypothetical protein